MRIVAQRYHDISCGHRVVGHEGKCQNLHGHNYRVHFECEVEQLDDVGRVIDFGVIKSELCMWLEREWDHKMLIWSKDPLLDQLHQIDPGGIVRVPFNPTAENMACHLLEHIGPMQLARFDGVHLTRVKVEETRKCGAEVRL